MKEINKIQSLSLAKILAYFYGIIGFFIGMGASISVMANIVSKSNFEGSYIVVAFFHIGLGVLLGIAVSFVTGFLGFLLGYITAAIYNMFARRIGGVKISLKDVDFK